MGDRENTRPGDDGFSGFERMLPENCVEYMLFIIDPNPQPKNTLSSLEAVRKAAVQLSNQLTKDYIWLRDGFSLEIKTEKGMFLENALEIHIHTDGVLTTPNRTALPPWHH